MKILVINCGSSSLKFRMFLTSPEGGFVTRSQGVIKRIGADAAFDFQTDESGRCVGADIIRNHDEAVRFVLNWLTSGDLCVEKRILAHDIDAVGHRVVHGGSRFTGPTVLDNGTIEEIAGLNDLAPLHNPVSVDGIRAARSILGKSVPMVVVFDTGYHSDIPEHASLYAIPYELSRKHRIKRYGPHGIAHRYMALRYSEITSTPFEQTNVITMQLGNGSSITAVRGGKHVDTSMGFTPLEGLIMGTRSGDIDPAVLFFLARKEGMLPAEMDRLLNFKSGLLGISGLSNDMGKILDRAAQGDGARARLAVEMFCYRVRKYIGAYLAVLGGAQAVVFGGGIGENSPVVREKICQGMEWCGLEIDTELNGAAIGTEGPVSAANARICAYTIPVDEEMLIARETFALVSKTP